MKLESTVALVTGSARRVGRAIAWELAQAGCDIAVHYRHSHRDATDLVEQVIGLGRRAVAVQADLADPTQCATLVTQTIGLLGRLDILVNNAAEFLTDTPDTLDGFDPNAWTRMLQTNLLAPAALAHHARPHLEKNEGGQIINICDIMSDHPSPKHLAYSISKAALVALTTALARDLAPAIRVNGVSPGIAVFPASYSEATRQDLTSAVPMQRAGQPEDIARAVRFLVESGDYITGQILRVDGGRSLS